MAAEWRDRVATDPDIHHGDPCIRGTRVTVTTIIASLADGLSPSEIVDAYPQLDRQDISAALAYAADVLREQVLLPLSA